MARNRHRGHREGSIYQRKDGRWVAALTLESGKRFYAYARTEQEAMHSLQEKKQTTQERPEEKISMVLVDLPFKSYHKITLTHARVLTQADYDERKGNVETREGPASFQVGDFLARDTKGVFPIRRVKVVRDYRQVSVMDSEGWADYEPLDTREATSIPFPFELHGQHGLAGDYIVKGTDSTWIIEKALFETCYQLLATDEERGSEGNNA